MVDCIAPAAVSQVALYIAPYTIKAWCLMHNQLIALCADMACSLVCMQRARRPWSQCAVHSFWLNSDGGSSWHWHCLCSPPQNWNSYKVWHCWQPPGWLLYLVLVSWPCSVPRSTNLVAQQCQWWRLVLASWAMTVCNHKYSSHFALQCTNGLDYARGKLTPVNSVFHA